MGYALVSAGAVNDNGTSSTGTASFGQATTAGNLLIAWMSSSSSGTTNPFSTSSAGWTLAVVIGDGGGFNWTAIYYKKNCGAGETAPTWTSSPASGASWWIRLAEFSGGDTSSPLDQTGSKDAGFVFTPNPVTATASAADTAGGDLLIVSSENDGGNGPITLTASATDSNGAAVSLTTVNNQTSTGTQFYQFSWGICGSSLGASANTATYTNSINQARNDIVIASFKPASGAVATSYGTGYPLAPPGRLSPPTIGLPAVPVQAPQSPPTGQATPYPLTPPGLQSPMSLGVPLSSPTSAPPTGPLTPPVPYVPGTQTPLVPPGLQSPMSLGVPLTAPSPAPQSPPTGQAVFTPLVPPGRLSPMALPSELVPGSQATAPAPPVVVAVGAGFAPPSAPGRLSPMALGLGLTAPSPAPQSPPTAATLQPLPTGGGRSWMKRRLLWADL